MELLLRAEGWTRLTATKDESAMERTDQQPHQHSPDAATAPLPPAAESALARLELRLNYPTDLYRAITRHQVASERTAQLSAWMDRRDLTGAEYDSFEWAQDGMRQARGELAAAGRLDLIGAGA